MNSCIRCGNSFVGRYPKSKICKACSRRGAPRGAGHWNYKDGSYTYETVRSEIREAVRYCERCAADLINAKPHGWCVHHRDHNHFNNERSNLELLCKRCHQVEHECWRAFESATTIPKGSTPKQVEARDILRDDDIV